MTDAFHVTKDAVLVCCRIICQSVHALNVGNMQSIANNAPIEALALSNNVELDETDIYSPARDNRGAVIA
jgi:hypothetical protein